jgi:hypothetical protein
MTDGIFTHPDLSHPDHATLYIGMDKTHSAMNCLRIPNLAERCKFAESRYDQLKELFELEVSI